MRITNKAVQVIQANHSPEAVAYAQRYAENFGAGLSHTLEELRKSPEEDCQHCRLRNDEADRTYSSIVEECLGKLRQAKADAELNNRFNDIIAEF